MASDQSTCLSIKNNNYNLNIGVCLTEPTFCYNCQGLYQEFAVSYGEHIQRNICNDCFTTALDKIFNITNVNLDTEKLLYRK